MPAATLQAPALPDISPIRRLLARTRLLLRSSWGTTGLGLTAGMALTILVAVTVIDMLFPLIGPSFRVTALVLLAVPTAWVFLVGVVLPLLRRLGPVELARRIESKIPGMHSRLVSCVDLERQGKQQSSPAFYRRLVDESLDRIGTYKASSIVDWRSVRNALLFAFASALLFAGLWLGFGERLPTALARIFRPFADIPPVSSVSYSVRPGTAKVLAGEDVAFAALVRGTPESLTLELYSPDASIKPVVHQLEKGASNDWSRTLKGLNGEKGFDKGFTYRILGGGTWSKLQRIDWIERPVLVETTARVHYPAYMAIPDPKHNPPKVRDVAGPEGGQVEIIVETEGQVARAEIQVLQSRTRRTAIGNRKERVWLDRAIPAGSQPSGSWQWADVSAGRGKTHANPPGAGTQSHGFGNAPVAFKVGKGEVLFANVFLHPLDPPSAIMLQWSDEAGNGEHRAYWGEDHFGVGVPKTPSRQYMGALPKAGEWVCLEVPAALVGLEDRALKGMAFLQFDGKVSWQQAGASLPPYSEEQEIVLTGTHRMQPVPGESAHWSGRFPLKGSGFYRVELKNELGYANKPEEKDPKFESIPDKPPEVLLERPGADMVVSKPQKVPLQIAVHDDFGLADVWLATQKEGELRFGRIKALKEYGTPNPLRGETLVTALDLSELGMKVGDTLRYRVEVRDRRPNSESVKSKDYAIRILADPNAADKQLEAFEKSQDPFREKLLKLIGDQAKVRDKIEQVQGKYEALDRKIQDAVKEAEVNKSKRPPNAPPDPKDNPLTKINPEDQKNLAALRKELADLFQKESQNVQLAQQAAQDLANTVNQASKLPLLNENIHQELKNLQDQFNRAAMNPLQDLARQFQQGAQPQQTPPNLKDLKRQGDRVQKELEALKNRADALANAQKEMRSNGEAALEKLKQDMLRERGNMNARELEELKEFLKNLREELARMQGKQEDLVDKTEKAQNAELPQVEKKQLTLDELLKRDLDKAKKILDDERAKRMRKPNLPDDPFAPDPKEKKVAPTEDDDPNSDPSKKKDAADPTESVDPKRVPKKDGEEDKEELFMPALGGEKAKPDPRFAKKQRPSPKKDGKNDPQAQRDNLRDRQDENLQNLDSAQRALQSDENAIEKMMRDLMNQSAKSQQNGKPMPGGGDEAAQALQQLKEMLQSEAMKKAQAMAQRARQGQPGAPNQPSPNPSGSQPNLTGLPPGVSLSEVDLADLTLQERAVLLRMPARDREELLQGMREEGPEGYRKFISDYFKRLNEAQRK